MFLSFVFRVRFTASVTQLFSYIVFVLLSPVPPDILIQHTKLRERLTEPTVMTKGNNLQFRRNVLSGFFNPKHLQRQNIFIEAKITILSNYLT